AMPFERLKRRAPRAGLLAATFVLPLAVAVDLLASAPALASPPNVLTGPATNITMTGATLNGAFNPNIPSGLWFRYGTAQPVACDDTFGMRAPATGDAKPSGGGIVRPFSEAVSGLVPLTRYYFCAVASNADGTVFGE